MRPHRPLRKELLYEKDSFRFISGTISCYAFVGAECTQVGTWYKIAVPELGMQVVPVYIEGAQDMHISSGKVFLVRFSGLDVRFDAEGSVAQYATADFIECVGIVEAQESGGI